MDREGFRNRFKQYKLAREENPGLKYWEWKNLPKYDEGGEVVDPIELMLKRRNVAINMQGKPNQFLDEWNTARLATGRFDAQLGNGNLELQKANRDSAPIFSTPNAFASRAALRGVVPIRLSSDTDQMVIDRYNSDLRVLANKLFKTVTSAEEGKERKGAYDQNSHTIYVKPDSPETLIHEQSHASKARPQEAKIAEILKNNDETKSLYYDDPTGREPYGRLMQVREANQIDPNKVWDKESYKEFKKNAIDFNFLNRYSDDTVIDIFNNVADAGNIQNEENKIFVAAEGGIVSKYDEGTEGVRDNTYVAPIEKEQVFIPATGAMKFLQEFRKRNPRGGNLEIVSPEFDLLTFGRSIGNAIYKNLPTDMVYRRTTQSEIDDIFESGVFRKLPEGKVAGKGKTFTINGKTVTLHKKGGNAHGGKAFSKGEPWRGTTVTGTADEVIVGIPGKGTQWKVGHHGDYSNHVPFEKIEKGKGLWEPFNERGIIENISPKGMRVFRPFAHGYKEDGLLPITGLNLIGENIDQYADGGEVTGPPTYELWDADMNQYNPTILDNASMYWSIEAAKKALHKEAMKLPGYAERWTEYYRSLPKNDPDINEFVDELWANENPNNAGLKNGKYYPHKSPEGGKPTIGPGFKIGSGSHRITKKQAERGMTKARLNQEARYIGKQHLNAVDQFINYGQTTNPADTVSPQIKMGLMDLRHQVGPLNEWGNLRQAVLNGDLEGIRKESTVTWNDNGKTKVDKRRKKIRDEKYFYYE